MTIGNEIYTSNTTSQGYKGTLPDIVTEFEYKKQSTTTNPPPTIEVIKPNPQAQELLPEPRTEKMYIDIIKKKDLTSNYINDLNDIILILERLKTTIINGSETQLFNAQVSAFIDQCIFLEQKYGNKNEASTPSYTKTMELSNVAYNVAILRREATIYGQYLSANEEGAKYTKENIDKNLGLLLNEINFSLPILKDAK